MFIGGENCLVYFMELLYMEKNTFRFIAREKVGTCPCCTKDVYNDQLYVEEKNVYHLTCYNVMKSEEQENNE